VTIEDYGDHRTISINGVNVAGTDLSSKPRKNSRPIWHCCCIPTRKRWLQIGFGSGGTAWAITRHPVKQINCVEITRGHHQGE